MEKQSRRGLLKNAAAAAVGAAGAAALVPAASAQSGTSFKKKIVPWSPPPSATPAAPATTPPLYSGIVTCGNLIFLSGIGAHFKGTIEEHTKHVLDEIESKLIAAGSSMDKVLKVSVFLSDLANYARMNAVYAGRFGSAPPARTTVATAGVPGDSLVEIDCIATI